MSPVERFDLNDDYIVDVGDVNVLLNYILSPTPSPLSVRIYTANGVRFTMVTVTGGTFAMGGTGEQGGDVMERELPVHNVTLSDYMIGITPVTQELWTAVMDVNPSYFTASGGYADCYRRPVEMVSYTDCLEFIARLNAITGETFRLPTEAEWEFAARGGNKSCGYKFAGSNAAVDVGWYNDNLPSFAEGQPTYGTQPVATLAPNELGLYDMSGNVWEWCSDWYGAYDNTDVTNPQGPSTGVKRVYRGGCWCDYHDKNCRVSCRHFNLESTRILCLGLRLAKDANQTE